jgi:hypothetical protein
MPSLPAQRSLALLRNEGFVCAIVERYNQYAKRRSDAFGWMDILAIRQGTILGVQTSRAEHMYARRDRILASDEARLWLAAGRCPECGHQLTGIELHGATKHKRDPALGGPTHKWAIRRLEVTRDK